MKDRLHFYSMIIIIICLILASLIIIINTMTPSDGAIVKFHTNQGSVQFFCEVAETLKEKHEGLRGVTELPRKQGMLFAYDSMNQLVFTMTGMSIPLDIIFIDENLTVNHIVEADIGEDYIHSNGPAQYVIEINKGLSREYEISLGTTVEIIFE